MFILDKPYVSEFLQNTAEKNHFPVLKTPGVEELLSNKNLKCIDEKTAVDEIKNGKDCLVYCNSENAIEWIASNLYFTDIPQKIDLFKDKVKFRKLISQIYPEFYFKEVAFEDIEKLNPDELKFPLVLKPSVGFLSFGVYMIYNKQDWIDSVKALKTDIDKFSSIYPLKVVDTSKFIIEEMIDGDEFAVDAYFDKKGEPVILNIFRHPFSSGKDVSDRVYYTSKKIIKAHLNEFQTLLEKIGKAADLKNFPVHIELRVNNKKAVPIEVNPMRFAGWCITDLAYWAWGTNVYEAYFNNLKPDWEAILEDSDDSIYYLIIADVPNDISKKDIKNIDYKAFLNNVADPLEVRKIDYMKHPLFAIVFANTPDETEMNNILKLDFHKYINL